MEPALETILESLPERQHRSKLEPHRELIRELRRKGRTYREVAHLLHERIGLYVAHSTIHSFIKVRAKHRKRTQYELPPMELTPAQSSMRDHVAAFQAKPIEQQTKRARFVFRENEPLTLRSDGGAR